MPNALCYIAESDVIGTPFFVYDYVEGRFYKDPSMKKVATPQERAALYGAFVSTIARVHTVNKSSTPISPPHVCAQS